MGFCGFWAIFLDFTIFNVLSIFMILIMFSEYLAYLTYFRWINNFSVPDATHLEDGSNGKLLLLAGYPFLYFYNICVFSPIFFARIFRFLFLAGNSYIWFDSISVKRMPKVATGGATGTLHWKIVSPLFPIFLLPFCKRMEKYFFFYDWENFRFF